MLQPVAVAENCRKILTAAHDPSAQQLHFQLPFFYPRDAVGNESVPKIIINDTMIFSLKLQPAFCEFQTITVSECCLIKLLPYILVENILIF